MDEAAPVVIVIYKYRIWRSGDVQRWREKRKVYDMTRIDEADDSLIRGGEEHTTRSLIDWRSRRTPSLGIWNRPVGRWVLPV